MIRLLLLFMLLCPSLAHAVTLISEDFEGACATVSARWPILGQGMSATWACPGTSGMAIVSTPVVGGTQSMRYRYTGSQYDVPPQGGGAVFKEYAQGNKEIWTTWWSYMPSTFQTAGGGGVGGVATKSLYTYMWSPQKGQRNGWVFHYFYGGRQLTLSAQGIKDHRGPNGPGTGTVIPYDTENMWHNIQGYSQESNKWVGYEARFKLNTPGQADGVYELYITPAGGTTFLAARHSGREFTDSTPTGTMPSDATWYQSSIYRQDGLGDMYIDNLSVTTTRVGLGTAPPPPPPSDTTPPSVPTSPVSSSVSGQVSLSWGASSDAVGVTSYTVRYCTGAACTPSTVGATVNGSTLSATISGLTAGTVIGMNVFASDAAGNASASSTTVYQTVAAAPASSDSLTFNSSGKAVLNGTQTFLIGISYLDATSWRASDIDAIASAGFNTIRIMTAYAMDTYGAARSVCDANGAIQTSQRDTVQALIDYAQTKQMVVYLTILTETTDAVMLTDAARLACVTNTVNAFKAEPLVLFEVMNEQPRAEFWAHTPELYAAYQAAAKAACPMCYFGADADTPSIAPTDASATINTAYVARMLASGQDYIDIHEYRSANSLLITGARATALKNYLSSIGRSSVPVIFGEPDRRGFVQDPAASEFLTAAVQAKNAGVALWVFHHGYFDFSSSSLMSQLDSVELAVVAGMSAALSGASSGTATALATDDFNRSNAVTLGANWTTGYTGTDSLQIVSNKIRPLTTASQSMSQYTGTSTPANHGLSAQVATLGAGTMYARLSVRMANPATYSGYDCRFNFNPDTVSITRKDNDNPVTIAGPVSATLSAGDTLWCLANGNTITIGQGAIDSAPLLSVTDSTYLSGTTAIYLNPVGNPVADLELDNYTLYEFVTPATPGVINHDTTAVAAAAAAVTTRTVSAVVSSGSDRLLVCTTQARGDNATSLVTSSVTFGGVAMTKQREDISGDIDPGGATEYAATSVWTLTAPAVSTANAVATWTGSISNVATAACSSFNGVDQTTPIGPVGGSTAASGATTVSTSVTPLVANAYLLDSVYTGDDTGNTIGAGQTSRSNRIVTGVSTDAASVSTEGPIVTPASTTMSWTPTGGGSTFYAHSVITINPTAPAAPPCTPSITSVVPGPTTATVGWDPACPPTSIRVAHDFGSSTQAIAAFPSGIYTPVGGWPSGMSFACFFAIDEQGTENGTDYVCGNWGGVLITDTTPPVMTAAFPIIDLPAGTTSTNFSITTNEPAVCRYALTNIAYSAMTDTHLTASLSHTGALTGLTNGSSTLVYNHCADLVEGVNNTTTTPLIITVNVAASTADTTPPTTVTNLVAAALSSSQVRLTHAASTDAGGDVVYQAFLSTDGSTYTVVSNYSGTTTDILNLQPNTLYYFKVLAFDPSLNPAAAYSNVATVTTTATPDTFPPTAVSGLQVLGVTQASQVLGWVGGVDSQGPTTTTIERCIAGSPPTPCTDFAAVESQLNGQSLVILLTPSTTYCYRALAVDQAGNQATDYSNTVCQATLAFSATGLIQPRVALPYGTSRVPRN